MKARDYCSPYLSLKNAKWDVTLHDRIWHFPKAHMRSGNVFHFSGWDHAAFFGNDNPVRVEYCCGNGLWIADRAKNDPLSNWVAIDIDYGRVRKVWAKIKNYQLSNLIVICAEGIDVTQTFFKDNSIAEVFVNFPDPWPKARHAKNRIVNTLFATQMQRILKPNGCINLVTDDVDYSLQMIDHFANHYAFECMYGAPHFIVERTDYGCSSFEELWRKQAKAIHYHQFKKKF